MTFLPIVERELRVAARQRFTFWSRITAALFALVIFGLLQLLAQTVGGASGAGQIEFTVLKWMAFLFALSAGLFLTSDSLSEEKREGTLGLLFLTDLRGYDVVFGKFLSQSLRAFYGLLAAFPIMALSLLSGGVTGGEFWRTLLAICNTLFFSLSLGILVSSISRDSTRAMTGTLLLGALILIGLPFADYARAGFNPARVRPLFALASPAYLFSHSGAYRFPDFWLGLPLQFALACAFLGFASWRTPHNWQDKPSSATSARPGLSRRLRYGSQRARAALRRRFMDPNPVVWLALRDLWFPRILRVLAIALLVLGSLNIVVQISELLDDTPQQTSIPAMTNAASIPSNSSGIMVVSSSTNSSNGTSFAYSSSNTTVVVGRPHLFRTVWEAVYSSFSGLFYLAIYLWMAAQAARFFVDGVRNGAMELLLVTPVTPRQIVTGQWTALWKTFLFPVGCLVGLHIAGAILLILRSPMQIGRVTLPSGFKFDNVTFALVTACFSIANLVAGLTAVAWYGMWMGFTNRKTSTAVLKTMLYVFVLPWIAFGFVSIFLSIMLIPVLGLRNSSWIMIAPTVFMGTLNLAKDCFFIWLGRLNILTHFRKEMTREHRVYSHISAPPPIASPPALPPVVPAT